MLLLRQAEQQARVEEELDRLSRLQSRIRLIEQETLMSQEVVLKQLPKQWVASVRETIANYPSVGQLYPKVIAGVGPGVLGQAPCFAMWHDPEFRESSVDGEAGIFLKEPVKAAGGVRVYELPAVTVASCVGSATMGIKWQDRSASCTCKTRSRFGKMMSPTSRRSRCRSAKHRDRQRSVQAAGCPRQPVLLPLPRQASSALPEPSAIMI
jgi:hypothetical protein